MDDEDRFPPYPPPDLSFSDEGLTPEEIEFFNSGVLEESIDGFLKGKNNESLGEAENIWNRACNPDFEPRLSGDRALYDVIRFDGEIMSGGLDHALDEDGYEEAAAAAAGLRLLGASDLAAVLEQARAVASRVMDDAGLIDIVNLTDAEEAELAALAQRYHAVAEGEQNSIEQCFKRLLASEPGAFEPE